MRARGARPRTGRGGAPAAPGITPRRGPLAALTLLAKGFHLASQLGDLHPGSNDDVPGFEWEAAHTLELPYMWPSFHHGIPLYPQLTPDQRQLSEEMLRYWGAFVRFRAPFVPGQTLWLPHQTGRLLSLRPGGASTMISRQQYATEHHCSFWDSLFGGG